jgi:hypothetical protein
VVAKPHAVLSPSTPWHNNKECKVLPWSYDGGTKMSTTSTTALDPQTELLPSSIVVHEMVH